MTQSLDAHILGERSVRATVERQLHQYVHEYYLLEPFNCVTRQLTDWQTATATALFSHRSRILH